jgi:hypothetical protein
MREVVFGVAASRGGHSLLVLKSRAAQSGMRISQQHFFGDLIDVAPSIQAWRPFMRGGNRDKTKMPWQPNAGQGFRNYLVPKKGLEPPHPCEYMDLNHARLPIPPLRHG